MAFKALALLLDLVLGTTESPLANAKRQDKRVSEKEEAPTEAFL